MAQDVSPEADLLEVYTSVWNTHDGAALGALFSADADLIMGNHPRVEGREAIGGWWQTYFSQVDAGRMGKFVVVSEREIAPGVRLLNVLSKTSGSDETGTELPTRLARGTWIVVERDGAWEIAAMRGLPAEGEQRVAPGTDR